MQRCIDETVSGIDREKRELRTEGGRVVKYSRLVICSGPWTNKVPGLADLSPLPLVVPNEQTLDFIEREAWPTEYGYAAMVGITCRSSPGAGRTL